jgi:phosphotransferase system  glucose/maltose/N-acetylglucosamine-specific IIC component
MKLKDVLFVLLKSFLSAAGCCILCGGILYLMMFKEVPMVGETLRIFLTINLVVGFGFSFLVFFLAFFTNKRQKIRRAILEKRIAEDDAKKKKADEDFQAKYYFKLEIIERATGNAVETHYPVSVWTSDK